MPNSGSKMNSTSIAQVLDLEGDCFKPKSHHLHTEQSAPKWTATPPMMIDEALTLGVENYEGRYHGMYVSLTSYMFS